MQITDGIRDADRQINEVSRKLCFSIINPANEPSVRRKFLDNGVKDPMLTYHPPVKNLLEFRRVLSSINITDGSYLGKIINDKRDNVIRKIDMLNAVGCFDFTERSLALFAKPDRKLVDVAYEILDKKFERLKLDKISSRDLMRKVENNFEMFGLRYKIARRDIVTSCYVDCMHRTIVFKKRHRYSRQFINKLIIHEIGTHVFRYENGKMQGLNVFKNGIANYLVTEEGLAAYNEERYGLLTQRALRNYAGRVVAIDMAQRSGFCDTFREMRRFFPRKTAFQLTLRSKRGISDTGLPGGYTKDLVYLKGYYLVKDFVEKGGDVRDLYYGKIGCGDVKQVKKLDLVEPKFVPDKFNLFDDKK